MQKNNYHVLVEILPNTYIRFCIYRGTVMGSFFFQLYFDPDYLALTTENWLTYAQGFVHRSAKSINTILSISFTNVRNQKEIQ